MSLTSYRLRYFSKFLRLFPPGLRGKARFARLLLHSCFQVRDVQIHAHYNCTFVVPSVREPIGFHLLVDGVYEVEAVEFVLERLRTGAVFVDIGANIGVFTLPAAAKVGPTGCVLAIEPSPRIFPYLKRNTTLNGVSNIRLRQCAVFNRAEPRLPFWEAPIEHFGMGALAEQFHADPIAVPAQTLDNIMSDESIERVDLLKVDVEGSEAAVFQGARQLLTGHDAPLILFEFCDWAETRVPGGEVGKAQRLLLEWGYRIWRLSDFVCGRPPLPEVLISGFETLIAIRSEP